MWKPSSTWKVEFRHGDVTNREGGARVRQYTAWRGRHRNAGRPCVSLTRISASSVVTSKKRRGMALESSMLTLRWDSRKKLGYGR